jgi:hypothetical protein
MDKRFQAQQSPTQSSADSDGIVYQSICSGTVIVMSAAEQPKYILGQLVVIALSVIILMVIVLVHDL